MWGSLLELSSGVLEVPAPPSAIPESRSRKNIYVYIYILGGPPPSNSDYIMDNKDCIRVLLYSYYATITGWGVLLKYMPQLPAKNCLQLSELGIQVIVIGYGYWGHLARSAQSLKVKKASECEQAAFTSFIFEAQADLKP